MDIDMDLAISRASEKPIETMSIETYPHLVEITDVVNWDNFREFSIGTKTFYTDGELTYEPAMNMDIINYDSENLVSMVVVF